jgi:hypothetical protein
MAAKSRLEKIADFVDRWTDDRAGRYEVRLLDGQQVVIHDCYLSRDQANRVDRIWVNYDSEGEPRIDFDPLEVASITDLDNRFDVIESP